MENIPMEIRKERRLELYEKTEKVERVIRQNKIDVLQEKIKVREMFLQYVAKDIACNEREIQTKKKENTEWNRIIDWCKENPVAQTEDPIRQMQRNIAQNNKYIKAKKLKLEKLRKMKADSKDHLKSVHSELSTFPKKRKRSLLGMSQSVAQGATENKVAQSSKELGIRHQEEHFKLKPEKKPVSFEYPKDPRRRSMTDTSQKQEVPVMQHQSADLPEEDEVVLVGEVRKVPTSSSREFSKISVDPKIVYEILRQKLGGAIQYAQFANNKRVKFDQAHCASATYDSNISVSQQLQETSSARKPTVQSGGYPDQVSQISSSESPSLTVLLEVIKGYCLAIDPPDVLGIEKVTEGI